MKEKNEQLLDELINNQFRFDNGFVCRGKFLSKRADTERFFNNIKITDDKKIIQTGVSKDKRLEIQLNKNQSILDSFIDNKGFDITTENGTHKLKTMCFFYRNSFIMVDFDLKNMRVFKFENLPISILMEDEIDIDIRKYIRNKLREKPNPITGYLSFYNINDHLKRNDYGIEEIKFDPTETDINSKIYFKPFKNSKYLLLHTKHISYYQITNLHNPITNISLDLDDEIETKFPHSLIRKNNKKLNYLINELSPNQINEPKDENKIVIKINDKYKNEAFKSLLNLLNKCNYLNEKIENFPDTQNEKDFVKLIRKNLELGKDFVSNLCLDLYKKHKNKLDLIINYDEINHFIFESNDNQTLLAHIEEHSSKIESRKFKIFLGLLYHINNKTKIENAKTSMEENIIENV